MGAAIPNNEWWRRRVQLLEEKATPLALVAPGIYYEKDGYWPAIKLVWMMYAVGLYLAIMGRLRQAGGWSGLHFIDLCSGSGLTRIHGGPGKPSKILLGSALIGANDPGFDHYHFVEPDPMRAAALEARLAVKLKPGSFTVHKLAAKDAVPLIVAALKAAGNPHYLAFVDPEGLTEATLPELQPLFRLGRGDVLFNFPSSGIKRAPEAASRFFGNDGWPREGSRAAQVEFFQERLKAHGRPKSTSIRVVAGAGSGSYEYEIVYCASETRNGNPWIGGLEQAVSKRMEGMDGKMLKAIIEGGQRALF